MTYEEFLHRVEKLRLSKKEFANVTHTKKED